MSEAVCSQFVLHAWKADICANCLKPRSMHVDDGDTSIVSKSEQCSSISSPAKHVNTRNFESAHLSNTVAAKPSPVKSKPVVSAKPEKPKKPSLTAEHTSAPGGKSEIKQCDEQNSSEHQMPYKLKNTVCNNASHFQFAEETSSCLGAPEFTHTTDTCVEDEEMHSNEKTAHHYELYDVTARGLSGTPRETEIDNGRDSDNKAIDPNLESEHGKFRTLPVAAMRVVEVAEQHVAMPYNVVDVTLPRQLSSSAGIHSTTPPTSTWPNKPQPTKRQVVQKSPPKPQDRANKPKEQTAPSDVDVSGHQEPDGCTKSPDDVCKTVQSDLVSDRYAHRIYEDIDDFHVDQFSSKTAARSSVNKSPAFEAKMAALASIDFNKTGKQVTTVAATVSPPEESISLKSDVAVPVQDAVVLPSIKPEKTRKSGGKKFLQKFLKFGSKDTSEAGPSSSAVSSGDEASSKVVECPGSPSLGKTSISDDIKPFPDTTPPQVVPLNSEKQAMLMNLKDCLAKRQSSVGGNSVDISPLRLQTQSSEPTSLRSSVQSAIIVPQACGSDVEKSDEHNAILAETSPPVNKQSDSLPTHGQQPGQQPASIDVPASVQSNVCKELSETDKRLPSVDKKSNEPQRLIVKDLSIVTEDTANADCSMSTCSSDAISPTPSDLSMEGGDHHSLKRKSRTDRQGSSWIHLLKCYHCNVCALTVPFESGMYSI